MKIIYIPSVKSKEIEETIKKHREFQENGAIENFIFYLNSERRLMMAAHNEEGVYTKTKQVEDFELLELCVYLKPNEAYITNVATLEGGFYHIIYDGKFICPENIYKVIDSYGFSAVFTKMLQIYVNENHL